MNLRQVCFGAKLLARVMDKISINVQIHTRLFFSHHQLCCLLCLYCGVFTSSSPSLCFLFHVGCIKITEEKGIPCSLDWNDVGVPLGVVLP